MQTSIRAGEIIKPSVSGVHAEWLTRMNVLYILVEAEVQNKMNLLKDAPMYYIRLGEDLRVTRRLIWKCIGSGRGICEL